MGFPSKLWESNKSTVIIAAAALHIMISMGIHVCMGVYLDAWA